MFKLFLVFLSLIFSISVFAMDVDPSYANHLFKMHKGTVKALRSNNVQRVASVLTQEKEALNQVFYDELHKLNNKHVASIELITHMPISVRAREMVAEDGARLKKEQELCQQHIERLQKYSMRELVAYKRLVSELTMQSETSSWVLDNKVITLSCTGVAGLLSQVTADPMSKFFCMALALASGYVSMKNIEVTSNKPYEHTQWYQNKEAILIQLTAFRNDVSEDIEKLKINLNRSSQITQ